MTTLQNTRIAMVTIDCADPRAEARFWAELLGGEIAVEQDEYAMVSSEGMTLGFGRVEGYEPPAWPNENGSKQFHHDLAAEDIPAAEQHALELGATLAEPQPGDSWRVLLDPAGHAFCLTDAASWG